MLETEIEHVAECRQLTKGESEHYGKFKTYKAYLE